MSRTTTRLYLAVLVLITLSLSALAQDPADARLAARDELQKGVVSYRAANYGDAIQHFSRAASLDPELLNARLYLATAYAQQYIPGTDTPENIDHAEKAIAAYRTVLDADPKNVNAIKGIAFLSMNMKRWDNALDYYQRATDADPEDAEAFYSVGVIEWTKAYAYRRELRGKSQLNWDTPAFDKSICSDIRTHNWQGVQHGMEMFDKALKLRPDYDDAMAYQNLMYRERADMQCGDQSAYDADIKQADEWVDKTMATKKAKEAAQRESTPNR